MTEPLSPNSTSSHAAHVGAPSMRIVRDQPFAGLESVIEENKTLAPLTWYRIGGPARYFATPVDEAQLQDVAQRCSDFGIASYVLGFGANLLVGDQGVDGCVVRLAGDHWQSVEIDEKTGVVTVGAGVDVQKLVIRAARAGLSGLECMAGIPGTVGGAVRMNAGGRFGDFGSRVLTVKVMDTAGTVFTRTRDDLVFGYRTTNISARYILGATLQLEPDDPDDIAKRTRDIWMYKRNSQPPMSAHCAGCIFKNPPDASAGMLIDRAGLKGLRVGNTEVSTIHANFIVAHPGATCADVLKLVNIIKERVYDKFQVTLESEVKVWP